MYRYISLVWDKWDLGQTAAAAFIADRLPIEASQWRCAFEAPGVVVFHAGERQNQMRAYPLPNQGGVVLGKLFQRQGENAEAINVVALGEAEGRTILGTGGRHLVAKYWGRYVAFLNDAAAQSFYVLRDPVGAFPCYFSAYEGVGIYFSDMEDCGELDLLQFSVNWSYVAALLKYPPIRKSETGLNEVFELLPGECLRLVAGRRDRTFYWNPARISETDVIEDPAVAALALRRATISCTTAWASCYRHVLHTLSGGLDSTVVLTCLDRKRTTVGVTCLNYFTPTPIDDERNFARVAAQHAGYQLIERELNGADVRLENVRNVARSARPTEYLYAIDRGQFEAQLVETIGADVIFSGCGGDAIFFQPHSVLGPVDYVHRHGIRPELLKIALDAARLRGSTVWSVLSTALRDGLRKRPWNPYGNEALLSPESMIVNRDILDDIEPDEVAPAWLTAADVIPRGKMLHILLVSTPPLYYDAFKRLDAPERVHPLVSQPLIELCLRIPTYVLTAGGKDRGLARLAFAYDLPKEIFARRTKAGADDYCKTMIKENIEFIREFLLEGVLARERFLDLPKAQRALAADQTNIYTNNGQILDLINVEAWLRRCQ